MFKERLLSSFLSDLRFDGGDFILFERNTKEKYIYFTFVSSFFLSFFIACSSLSSISIEFERWFEREEGEGIGAVGVRLSIGGRCIGENEKKGEREKKRRKEGKKRKKKSRRPVGEGGKKWG